jgi:hypothetical protein
VDPLKPQDHGAGVRDLAVRKLRDVTIAVAIAGAAGVGAIAWVSAATIPGSSDTSPLPATVPTRVDDRGPFSNGDGFTQGGPVRVKSGPGLAVSGGSH